LGIYHWPGDHAALRRVAGKEIGARMTPNAPKERNNDR
jgi:hypothetical protein